MREKIGGSWATNYNDKIQKVTKKNLIIPPDRTGYLGEIVQTVRQYQEIYRRTSDRGSETISTSGYKTNSE